MPSNDTGLAANASNSTPVAETIAQAPTPAGEAISSEHMMQLKCLTIPAQTQQEDEIAASPLLTVPALDASASTQYGLIGADSNTAYPMSTLADEKRRLSARIFQNVSAPSSTFICGSQGSGKSNTLACLLENCLIPSPLGSLPRPLTGIVFHYDSFNSDVGGLPCEAAYLVSTNKVEVRILCAPTNIRTIKDVYRHIPGVTIQSLQLTDRDLNTKRMLDLMALNESGMPLYMHVVSRVLKEMRLEQQAHNNPFSYNQFKLRIRNTELTTMQSVPLKQRLDTLESFMAKTTEGGNDWTAKPGRLTIVDLSCPCVTPEMACSLFNISLHLFLEGDKTTGRIVALDEAHKYMREGKGESRLLTDNLLAIIRLQRHLAVRVIISTQEPTISPKLLDLCSVTVVHRFTSPDWLRSLQSHLAGLSPMAVLVGDSKSATNGEQQEESEDNAEPISVLEKDSAMELFGLIVGLKTGQALVFSPSTIIGIKDTQKTNGVTVNGNSKKATGSIERLGHRALLVDIRTRLTEDGGRSIMAL